MSGQSDNKRAKKGREYKGASGKVSGDKGTRGQRTMEEGMRRQGEEE